MRLVLWIVGVALGKHCSQVRCGEACTRGEAQKGRCWPSHACRGVGEACAAEAARAAERDNRSAPLWRTTSPRFFGWNASSCVGAERSWPPLARRDGADFAACAAARCATVRHHRSGRIGKPLFQRWATFRGELAVVSPHKAGSKYVRDSFARAYNCTIGRAKEIAACGDDGVVRPGMKKVVVVRDPVDRAVAMYNHFCVSEGAFGLEPVCRGLLDADELRIFGAGDDSRSSDAAARVHRFEKFLECVGPHVRDLGELRGGIQFRHFQPAARYAHAADADVVGRVEALADLLDDLAESLPVLRRSLAEDPDRAPDPWLGDVEKVAILVNRTGAHKASGSPDDAARGADGHDIHPWSVHRCDLPPTAEATIRDLYATDWACFGAVFPATPPRDEAGPPPEQLDATTPPEEDAARDAGGKLLRGQYYACGDEARRRPPR